MVKSLTVSPAATYPLKRQAERKLAMTLKGMFGQTKKKVLPKLVEAYRKVVEEHRPATTKALGGERDSILAQLDLDAWVASVDALGDTISSVQAEAAKRALTALRIDDKDLFNQVNDDAVEAAEERAASMVGMRWENGKLIPNPSAEYAITETTREGISDMVKTSLTDGLTVDEFASKLVNAYQFSDRRAETIARTEIATAHVEGTLTAWKATGQVEGKRVLVGSGEVCDECEAAEAEGVIGIDEEFDAGDAPPFHPRCVCVLLAELKEETDDTQSNTD